MKIINRSEKTIRKDAFNFGLDLSLFEFRFDNNVDNTSNLFVAIKDKNGKDHKQVVVCYEYREKTYLSTFIVTNLKITEKRSGILERRYTRSGPDGEGVLIPFKSVSLYARQRFRLTNTTIMFKRL